VALPTILAFATLAAFTTFAAVGLAGIAHWRLLAWLWRAILAIGPIGLVLARRALLVGWAILAIGPIRPWWAVRLVRATLLLWATLGRALALMPLIALVCRAIIALRWRPVALLRLWWALAIGLAITAWGLLRRIILLVSHWWHLPVLWWPLCILVRLVRAPLPTIRRALAIMRKKRWLQFIILKIRQRRYCWYNRRCSWCSWRAWFSGSHRSWSRNNKMNNKWILAAQNFELNRRITPCCCCF
jgi:hypothetical protein